MGTGERFSQRYFMHKGLKTFGQEGSDNIIKDMYQLDRWTSFEYTVKYKRSGGCDDTGAKYHN